MEYQIQEPRQTNEHSKCIAKKAHHQIFRLANHTLNQQNKNSV